MSSKRVLYANSLVVLFMLALQACNPESKPIVYGQDKCEFCRMSIVDQRFGLLERFTTIQHYVERIKQVGWRNRFGEKTIKTNLCEQLRVTSLCN